MRTIIEGRLWRREIVEGFKSTMICSNRVWDKKKGGKIAELLEKPIGASE